MTQKQWIDYFYDKIIKSNNKTQAINEIKQTLDSLVYSTGSSEGEKVSDAYKNKIWQELLQRLNDYHCNFSRTSGSILKIACESNEEAIHLIKIVMEGK